MPKRLQHNPDDVIGFSSKLPFKLIQKLRAMAMEQQRDQAELLVEAIEEYLARNRSKKD